MSTTASQLPLAKALQVAGGAVAVQRLDLGVEVRARPAAVEERHLVAARQRALDQVAPDEERPAEDEDPHRIELPVHAPLVARRRLQGGADEAVALGEVEQLDELVTLRKRVELDVEAALDLDERVAAVFVALRRRPPRRPRLRGRRRSARSAWKRRLLSVQRMSPASTRCSGVQGSPGHERRLAAREQPPLGVEARRVLELLAPPARLFGQRVITTFFSV